MSYILHAFPLLYLNLGGELLYIIEQRLQAQNIVTEKSEKGEKLLRNRFKNNKIHKLN